MRVASFCGVTLVRLNVKHSFECRPHVTRTICVLDRLDYCSS